MPGFDGTGPRGMGPMTGGGRGYCNPYASAYGLRTGYGFRPGYGASFGRPFWGGGGFGRGRGYRAAGYAVPRGYGYGFRQPYVPYYASPYGPYPYGW